VRRGVGARTTGVQKGAQTPSGPWCAGALLTVTLITGTVNRSVFEAWLSQDLLPKLPPQSVLVLDNAAFHKGAAIQRLVEQAGHTLLYLPALQHPIEHTWAKAKALRRKTQCSIEVLFQNKKL